MVVVVEEEEEEEEVHSRICFQVRMQCITTDETPTLALSLHWMLALEATT